jgi:hypothetical protein
MHVMPNMPLSFCLYFFVLFWFVKQEQKQKEEVEKKEIKKLKQDKYCFCVFLVFLFLNSRKRSMFSFPLILFLEDIYIYNSRRRIFFGLFIYLKIIIIGVLLALFFQMFLFFSMLFFSYIFPKNSLLFSKFSWSLKFQKIKFFFPPLFPILKNPIFFLIKTSSK